MEKVIAVVGARLSSSRMPRKHLLDLAGAPLIYRVVERLERAEQIDQIVLATTADEVDQDLVTWAKSERKDVFAYQGDVNDLTGRIDAVVQDYDPSIIVYVCGDSPLIEPATIDALVASLKGKQHAEYARLEDTPKGRLYIHEGFAVYRRSLWDRMTLAAVEPFEREHVGSVFHSLQKVVPVHEVVVQEDPIYHALNHRISVDTPADYAFMNELYVRWYASHDRNDIVSLKWVISLLQAEPGLMNLNRHVRQKTINDTSNKVAILTGTSHTIGLGHLRRMTEAGKRLVEDVSVGLDLVILGNRVELGWLKGLAFRWIEKESEDVLLTDLFKGGFPDILFVDLPNIPNSLVAVLQKLKQQGVKLVCVDQVVEEDLFDHFYIPCFTVPDKLAARLEGRITYGWQSYLLPSFAENTERDIKEKKLIVMTGASDTYKLGEIWPRLLDERIDRDVQIFWIQGPFAPSPSIDGCCGRDRFRIIQSPDNLLDVASQCSVGLCVYGVSYFELLNLGVGVVGLVPPNGQLTYEVSKLDELEGFSLTDDSDEAVTLCSALLLDPKLHEKAIDLRNMLWPGDGKHSISQLTIDLLVPSEEFKAKQ